MRCRAALLLPGVLAVMGCASIDAGEAGRAWQRHECLRQPGPEAQRRCEDRLQQSRRVRPAASAPAHPQPPRATATSPAPPH